MVKLDKLIHERVRLLILTCLASSEKQEISFTRLKETLELTPGNLSVQLNKLQKVGYLKIEKMFKSNRPLTTITLTMKGLSALKEYLADMESIITRVKSSGE